MLLCLKSDYLPGAGWESNTYFPSLSTGTGQMWCPQVQLLCCGSIPSEDKMLTPWVECGKGQAGCGLVFPIGSCEAPSPGAEVRLHPHGLRSQLTELCHPMDARRCLSGVAQHSVAGQLAARWQGCKAPSSVLSPMQLAELAKNTLCTFPLPSSLPRNCCQAASVAVASTRQ